MAVVAAAAVQPFKEEEEAQGPDPHRPGPPSEPFFNPHHHHHPLDDLENRLFFLFLFLYGLGQVCVCLWSKGRGIRG